MSLKFDTKLMKVADDFADFDLLKPKERAGPHFQTQETDSMFILTVQLEGYRRTNIKVEINEDWSIIIISGEKPFQDTLMVGGKVVKKDIEMRGFQKSFKIPRGVVLTKVNARFNEDDSKLTVQMPKVMKGFTGVKIEELKTKEILTEATKVLKVYSNDELFEHENQEMQYDDCQDHKPRVENNLQPNESEIEKPRHDSKEPKSPQRRFKICTPVIFGSAFFMSLIVLVFHFVQSEKPVKQERKKDED